MAFGVVLVIFGPKKLPEIGRSFGKGLKEFRQSAREVKDAIGSDDDIDDEATISKGGDK